MEQLSIYPVNDRFIYSYTEATVQLRAKARNCQTVTTDEDAAGRDSAKKAAELTAGMRWSRSKA